MDAVRFRDRDVVAYDLDGVKQPFYRSTGRNSGMPGVWLPFEGWAPPHPLAPKGWFIKYKTRRYGRLRNEACQAVSEALGEMNIPEGHDVSGEELNAFLRASGCVLDEGAA